LVIVSATTATEAALCKMEARTSLSSGSKAAIRLLRLSVFDVATIDEVHGPGDDSILQRPRVTRVFQQGSEISAHSGTVARLDSRSG